MLGASLRNNVSLCGRFEAVVSLSEVGLFEIPRDRFLCIVATISGAV